MESDDERLAALLAYSGARQRICPQPAKWNDFWNALGCPTDKIGPPLVLAGWAFSTDREKRARFQDHVRYAAGVGLLDEAEEFVRTLADKDWHSCPDDRLDWSYGDSLMEDEQRREEAISAAEQHYAALKLLSDSTAFSREHFAETLFLFYLLFLPRDVGEIADRLRQATKQYSSLVEGDDFCLLDGAQSSVAEQLRELARVQRTELHLFEILLCITEAQIPMDRDAVEEFVEAMFERSSAARHGDL